MGNLNNKSSKLIEDMVGKKPPWKRNINQDFLDRLQFPKEVVNTVRICSKQSYLRGSYRGPFVKEDDGIRSATCLDFKREDDVVGVTYPVYEGIVKDGSSNYQVYLTTSGKIYYHLIK